MHHDSASFWELTSFQAPADFLIIGAGITGMNAAISLKSRQPEARVIVLDKGPWGDGASYRNAGFACLGSPTELLADMQGTGIDQVMSIVDMRWKGLQFLIDRVGERAMDLHWCGGMEFFPEQESAEWEAVNEVLPVLNQHFREILGITEEQFTAVSTGRGFRQGRGQIQIRKEGRLHPGKMMVRLQELARDMGVIILGGIDVTGWESGPHGIHVTTKVGRIFQTRRLGLATNGFTPRLIPGLDLVPARNQVYLTEIIPGLTWDFCVHVYQGFVYARRIGDQILIGGGRHLNKVGEMTDEEGITSEIESYLLTFLRTHFDVPPDIRFAQSWSGIMGMGSEKMPIVRELEENIFAAVRLGGMGVAIGSLVGDNLAQLMLSQS